MYFGFIAKKRLFGIGDVEGVGLLVGNNFKNSRYLGGRVGMESLEDGTQVRAN